MDEYKGIYYGDETEQKFYEGGAHFKYSKLYRILEKLAKERNAKEKKQDLLYVHKANNINKGNNFNNHKKNINKKTRNIIDNLDINKFQYNTINNNFNNINYNFQNNYNIFLSINKDNHRNKIGNNFSITNHKEIESRNKESTKAFKGRPNTILKESLQKSLYTKKNKMLSSSMEQKDYKKYKVPMNLKQSLPDFKFSNIQKINKHSSNKTYKLNCDINLGNTSNKYNIIKVYKNNDINNLLINNNNYNLITNSNNDDLTNFNNINSLNNDIQQNISYSNVNKISMKTERIHPAWEKKNDNQIVENYTEIKNRNKNQENIFNKINVGNNMKISKKTHNIINKRIISNKNLDINPKNKTIIFSDLLNKSKIDKEKIDLFLNKSSNKKKNKRNINIYNKINNNNSSFGKTKLKINAFNNTKKDLDNDKKILTEKKLINLKKIDKSNDIKFNDNQLSFNKFISKSRNYNGKNTSFQIKKTFNNKNNDNLNSNEMFKNYFKTMGDVNNKKNNFNFVYKTNNNKINVNKTSVNNKINDINKKPYEIKPYLQIKSNNGLKNKINLNSSIKANKKNNNFYFQK